MVALRSDIRPPSVPGAALARSFADCRGRGWTRADVFAAASAASAAALAARRFARARGAPAFGLRAAWVGHGRPPRCRRLRALGGDVQGVGRPPARAPVTLRSDVRVSAAIEQLLRSGTNYVGDDLICVRVINAEPRRGEGGGRLACICVKDLLEAPDSMPLDCLIGLDKTECEVYDSQPEPYFDRGAAEELLGRLPWLVGLLFFLTVSSAILEYFDGLLQRHLVIAIYLTPLVGCGGNAGSQAALLVLQAMARGDVSAAADGAARVLAKELAVALGAAAALGAAVAARIAVFGGSAADALSIAGAMVVTVIFSVLFGALCPLALKRLGLDPARVSGPLLSTVTDIAGVLFACAAGLLFEAMGWF